MSMDLIRAIGRQSYKKVPKLKAGQTVRVHQRIKDGDKERTQIFEGLVIKISSGSGTGKTFTVRRVFQGIGVEKIFPFHSPNVLKIELVKSSKVRRSKLYYMRELTGKAARLKERILSAKDLAAMSEDTLEEIIEEAPVEETTAEAPVTEAPATESPAEEAKTETPAPEAAKEETAKEEAPVADAPAEEAKEEPKEEEK